jgi:bifunctional non-homologous end joining protein LigD
MMKGDDLRRDPLEVRKATLASIMAKASSGIRFNEQMEGDGETVFRHACKLGLKALFQSARIPPTAPLARPIGSK